MTDTNRDLALDNLQRIPRNAPPEVAVAYSSAAQAYATLAVADAIADLATAVREHGRVI